MSMQRFALLVACAGSLSSAGCQSDADEVTDSMAADVVHPGDVGVVDASDDTAIPDASVCSCTDPVDGVCTVHPLNADDGWVFDTLADGTECRRREGPFFCNNGCGSPGQGQLWFNEDTQQYVHFFSWPCVTDSQRDHWRLVPPDSDGHPGEYTAVVQRFDAAPDCAVE